ncbi:hypothetical protein DYB36_000552 [Aphanomyces astaci]|uniref:Uncharacterized protein n=1 Tax=Aphanomyces astaci TaxID=112090 RepID=A0A397AC56_APHAT|nr:hypothetical protein DYB36_000552 [Aphanomyces astaci]
MAIVELWTAYTDDAATAGRPPPSQEGLRDVGLLLATQDLSPDMHAKRIVDAVTHLYDTVKQQQTNGTSLVLFLDLVRYAFEGLKVTKQFAALDTTCHQLLPVLLSLIDALFRAKPPVSDATLPAAVLTFVMDVLVGYQHSSALYVAGGNRLLAHFETIQQWLHSPDHVVDLSGIGRTLVLTVCCLARLHPGCRDLNAAFSTNLLANFGVAIPAATDLDATLRHTSWLPLSEAIRNDSIPTVEGLWTLDENVLADATPRSGNRNAGSVVLRHVSACHGVAFSATMHEPYDYDKILIDLSGDVVTELVEPSSSTHDLPHQISLQGQWQHVLDATAPNSMQAPSQEWTCAVCTVANAAGARVCSTCAAPAPTVDTTHVSAHRSNPAPFAATVGPAAATDSFMDVRWSRGDQHGKWLARRQRQPTAFELNATTDVRAAVYTPRGRAADCLVVETLSNVASNCPTSTVEFWSTQWRRDPSQSQVLVANGEFSVSINQHGHLVWQGGASTELVVPPDCLPPSAASSFVHVALVWDVTVLSLVLNGRVVCQAPRPTEEQNGQRKVLVLGGAPTDLALLPLGLLDLPRGVYGVDRCFDGSLVEVRLWSVAVSVDVVAHRSRHTLHGDEEGLVAYFPLVGGVLYRDASRHGHHHATWFNEYHRIACPSWSCPVSQVELGRLPVVGHRWQSQHGLSFCGHISKNDHHVGLLQLASGSAVWTDESVNLSQHVGFYTEMELAMPEPSSVCVAWSDVSFWDLSPLIHEASALDTTAAHDGRSPRRALFVQMTTNAPNDDASVSVFVWADQTAHCLSVVHTTASSFSASTLGIRYDGAVLSVYVGNRLLSVLSLDLGAALASTLQRVRVGVVSPLRLNSSVQLAKWMFETTPAAVDIPNNVPAVRCVYGLDAVPPTTSSSRADAAAAAADDGRVSCTKHRTDGSAIVQELYMCQTCDSNLVFCAPCATVCHHGHELVWMGKVSGACGCHTRGVESCMCFGQPAIQTNEMPQFSLWRCVQCTVVNAITVSQCAVCASKSPLPSAAPATPVLSTGLFEVPAAEWSCPACTMLNDALSAKCTICDTGRPDSNTSSTTQNDGILSLYHAAAEVTGPWWVCNACTMQNDSSDVKCGICGTLKPLPLAMPVATPVPDTATPLLSVPEHAPTLSQWLAKKHSILEQKRIQHESTLPVTALAHQDEVWETTQGLLIVKYADTFVGDIVHGEYTDTKNSDGGGLCGVLKTSLDIHHPRLELRAKYKPNAAAQDNSCVLIWPSRELFDGYWYRGDGSGAWKCTYTPLTAEVRGLAAAAPSTDDLSSSAVVPFYSGLANMTQGLTNVCYQNSFLQILFMTHTLRDAILACPSPNPTLATVQHLFARMLQSRAPCLATHDLQAVLPPTFQAGRQQDVCDFAHFLMESISTGFEDAIHELVGGTTATIVACKSADCGHVSVTREYFWELLLNMVDLRYTPITSIRAVHGTTLRIPTPARYDRLNYDLNKDRTGAPYVFLCVQRDASNALPITDILIKVCDAGEPKPTLSGYNRVELDLNMGTSSTSTSSTSPSHRTDGGSLKKASTSTGVATTESCGNGGKKQIYLFYGSDPHGSPVTDLTVIYNQDAVPDGFKVIRVDLNQGEGAKVFLCYRCDMPVTDIKLQYIAHTDGGSGPCITGLRLVPADQVASLEAAAWEDLHLATNDRSPPSASNHPPLDHLMVQRGHGNPLYAIEVFRSPRMVPKYSDYETISVVTPPPVEELTPDLLLGDWFGGDDIDRSFRAVQFTHTVPNLSPTWTVSGVFGKHNGRLTGVLQSFHTLSHVLWGSWTDSTTKWPQLVHLVFRFDASAVPPIVVVDGVVGDGKAKLVNFRATQATNVVVPALSPITELLVARGSDLPLATGAGTSVLCGLHGDLFLLVRRDPHEAPVKEVCVVYGGIDPIPDGYVCVDTTVSGATANLNTTSTTDVGIFICFKRDSLPTSLGVTDVVVVTSNVPAGYTKLQHTPLGMDASLVQGKSIYIAIKRVEADAVARTSVVVEHALNGQYDTSLWGRLQLTVLESVQSSELMGSFSVTSSSSSPGILRGIAYPKSTNNKNTMIKCVGLWEPAGGQTLASYNASIGVSSGVGPFEFEFALQDDKNICIPVADGWWSRGGDGGGGGGPWRLVQDCYVQLAYKKDYGSEWAHGHVTSSERVSRHSVASMLHRFGSVKTLGGDFTCSGCHRRTESRVHSVVVMPPAHLILTFKRMYYDWKAQKTCKSLHDVSFPAVLTLPALSPADAATLAVDDDTTPEGRRTYGLYGVLVHSGLSANSGHYYSFGRSSASNQLHLEDDPTAPWIQFNDSHVRPTTWNDLHATIESSVSDSVYLLFYKRLEHVVMLHDEYHHLSAASHEDKEEDKLDEEAMLLAKAMALSMSTQDTSPRRVHTVSQDKSLDSLDPLRSFPHVMFVNVSKNSLTDVSEALAALEFLVSVNLSENQLTTVPKFNHAFLKDVDLSKNQLTSLQDAEGKSIVALKLNGNQLTSIDGLANFTSLKSVELARNHIDAISLATDMPNVDHVVLVRNSVTELDSYRLDLLLLLPRIKKLDGIPVTDDERVKAIALKQQRDAAAKEAADL